MYAAEEVSSEGLAGNDDWQMHYPWGSDQREENDYYPWADERQTGLVTPDGRTSWDPNDS